MLDHISWPLPGRYILAVSGGADSIALLDLFAAGAGERSYELVVAHFDHGLRADSAADRALVEDAARAYGLPFVAAAGALGQASEAAARAARYQFLERVRAEHQATAIITAHHQDDLIETSLLNLARGTGRRGLAPLQTRPGALVLRPLLQLTRAQLRAYAAAHNLIWHDDPTNAGLANPRNFLRHELLAAAGPAWRGQYLGIINRTAALNKSIDTQLGHLLDESVTSPTEFTFPRQLIQALSLPELAELLHAAGRQLVPGLEPDRRLLAELALFAKTARPHRRRPLRFGLWVASMETGLKVYYMGISSRFKNEG